MIRHSRAGDDGLTGLELIIIILLLTGGAALSLTYLAGGTPDLSRAFPGGLVADSVYISGDHIQTVGNVYGFPMTSRTSGTPVIVSAREDPNNLGAVKLVVSLFIGDTGAIDMDHLQVSWNRRDGSEMIRKTSSPALVCPNWTISGKYNMLPGRTADADDWLEPGEQFELTLCPSEGVPPYRIFSLILQPDGTAAPLTVTRMAPPRIQPVMNLG